jgi:hypothetical protein
MILNSIIKRKGKNMKSIISKYFVITILTLLTSSTYSFADANLPVSQQVKDNTEDEKIEIVPEIKIEAQSSTTPSDSKLKEGKSCNDDLEEVEGELFVEIPMAETIPCSTVDCKDLKPAKLLKDNYKKLKIAKTIRCGE